MPESSSALLLRLIRRDGPVPELPSGARLASLLELAHGTQTAGLVAQSTFRLEVDVPEALRREVAEIVRAEKRHHALHFIETRRALDVLGERDIEAVVVKGVGLAHELYESPVERHFRDIDLLVLPEERDAALSALAEAGWQPLSDPEATELYRAHHFHVILGGPGRAIVELHWSMTRPDALVSLPAALLFEGRRLVPGHAGGELPLPSREGHALVAASSLLRDGFCALKPLVDLDRLVCAGGLDAGRLAALAAGSGLERALAAALELSRSLLGAPVDPLLDALPSLGARRERLARLGLERLPFTAPDPATLQRAHAAQLWLAPSLLGEARRLGRGSRFERAMGRLRGRSSAGVLAAEVKRGAQVARLLLWQLGLLPPPRRAVDHERLSAVQD